MIFAGDGVMPVTGWRGRRGVGTPEIAARARGGARRVLFGEFVWPWLPAYLGAVSDRPPGPLTGWAELTLDALRDEREQYLDPAAQEPVSPRPRSCAGCGTRAT